MCAVLGAVFHVIRPRISTPTVETMTANHDAHTQDARIQEAQQQVLDEARKVNDERLKAVEELAAAVAHRVDLEKQVHEAKKEEKRLMTIAEKHGWTRAQVNKFSRAPKTTGKRPQQPNSATAQTAPTETPEEASPGDGYSDSH